MHGSDSINHVQVNLTITLGAKKPLVLETVVSNRGSRFPAKRRLSEVQTGQEEVRGGKT